MARAEESRPRARPGPDALSSERPRGLRCLIVPTPLCCGATIISYSTGGPSVDDAGKDGGMLLRAQLLLHPRPHWFIAGTTRGTAILFGFIPPATGPSGSICHELLVAEYKRQSGGINTAFIYVYSHRPVVSVLSCPAKKCSLLPFRYSWLAACCSSSNSDNSLMTYASVLLLSGV
jgi:hypothetical protein